MFDAEEYVEITFGEDGVRFDATIHLRDARNLLLACPPEAVAYLRPGTPLQLAQLIGGNFYQLDTTILRCQHHYCVVGIVPPKLVQRRSNPRYVCQLAAVYMIQPNALQTSLESASKPVECRLRDISLGGMKVITPEFLLAGTPMVVQVILENEETTVLPAEALRCTPLEGDDAENPDRKEFAIACRYGTLTRRDQIQLHRYLMHLSRATIPDEQNA